MSKLSIFIFVLTLSVLSKAGEIHKWTDADGAVHFGDRPPMDVDSELVYVKPIVYDTPSIEALKEVLESRDGVIMYSASWCGYCKKARAYFSEKRIPYKEYDVETSEKGKRDYARLGAKGIPVILVGSKRLNGFSAKAFEQAYSGAR